MSSIFRFYICARRNRVFRLLPFLCILGLFTACSPITYRHASPPAALANAASGPERIAQLEMLKSVLAKYGTPVPMDDAPGFIVTAEDYSINAKLAGERDLDLTIYWAPGNHSIHGKLSLPLLIADIHSGMAEGFASKYTIQPQ